jgi:outer membrane biosynthesis protein TonB
MLMLLIAIGLISGITGGLLSRPKPPPETEKYEYTDSRGGRYQVVPTKGHISDSSFHYDSKYSRLDASAGRRSPESILAVLRTRIPELKKTYDRYYRRGRFRGKVDVKLTIAPDGNVASIYLLRDTTHNQRFIASILEEIRSWSFEETDRKENDVISVPFDFNK